MALRLGENVVAGQLDNRQANTTRGWLELRGVEERLQIELTGDLSEDLSGKNIYFECSENEYSSVGRLEAKEEQFPNRYVGATGTMTADQQVRLFDCPIEEFLCRCKLGEPPPTFWVNCLYLEWYGNGGRVVVEMADARLWLVDDAGALHPVHREPQPPKYDDAGAEPPSMEIVQVEAIDEETAHVQHFRGSLKSNEDDDPYSLYSDDFRELIGESKKNDGLELVSEEYKLLEGIWGGSVKRDRLGDVIGPPPDWDSASDEELETRLKTAIAQMGLLQISYHICEHMTQAEACRVLFEKLADCEIHHLLKETSFFCHFSASDDCEKCIEEMDAEFK